MLWTTIAVLTGIALIAIQLQLAREQRWDVSHWLSGSLFLWFSNALFAVFVFLMAAEYWPFAVTKTALVGSAFFNVILLGLALFARRLAHDEPVQEFGQREIAHGAVAGVSFVAGLVVIAYLWTFVS